MAGYSDGTLRVFDVGKVQMVRKMHPHASPVKAVAYSVDGKERISVLYKSFHVTEILYCMGAYVLLYLF